MSEMSVEGTIYSRKWFKSKLKDHYKESIFFSEQTGKSDIVCFNDTASSVISDNWYKERKQNVEEEKRRIIEAAANLIRCEVRSTRYSTDKYPSKSEIENCGGFLPPSLQYFMQLLVTCDTKQESIGQCILKAMKPQSAIPPLQLGLAVEVASAIGSKWLNNELSRLGFAVTYNEVIRFKQSILFDKKEDSDISPASDFTQWVSDNVDHNIATLDGKGTFHGMGIISCSVGNNERSDKQIKRLPSIVKVADLPTNSIVKIHRYANPEVPPLASVKLLPLDLQNLRKNTDELNLLWHYAGLKHGPLSVNPRANWNGFMDQVTSGRKHPGKTTINMLPIIDLKPSDVTCVYSTLLHVIKEAQKLQINTPCITMDQPLWIKAVEIAFAQNLRIVARLGGFHTLMSFVGSVGSLMEASGLEALFETMYGKNTIVHMFSGKAISRALRGHFLADAALKLVLMKMIISGDESLFDDLRFTKEDATELNMLYSQVCSNGDTIDEIKKSPTLRKLDNAFHALKESLRSKSRTAKLWLLYMDYVDVMKLFIQAERSGDWRSHLEAVQRMLALFAATGHVNYAKSARLYLQQMRSLEINYPWLHKQFMENGFHCIRRSEKFWAGIWTDLAIEQTLMRSIKSRGGLTRGSGMTESVRLVWVSTLHECSTVRQAMNVVTGAVQKTSEQHVELSSSRVRRDNEDLGRVSSWLDQFNPLQVSDNRLRSLSSGLAASDGDGVNCDEAEIVGSAIQKRLDGVTVDKASIPRSQQVKSLQHLQQKTKINNETVPIDPSLLFVRLVVLLERKEDMDRYFDYELTPVPTSLFRDRFMRHPDKSSLAHALQDKVRVPEEQEHPNTETNTGPSASHTSSFVLDGGALLHRVFWNGETYMDVINQYRTYVHHHYGVCSVVFDGYQSKSTKDHEHSRRSQVHQKCPDIAFTEDNTVHVGQHFFLTNSNNKERLIDLISKYLKQDGHDVRQCDNDADTAIVDVALEYACSGKPVTVIAEDTDILVLLVYFWNSEMAEISMRCQSRKGCQLKVYDIARLAQGLDNKVVKNILFLHAWGGCDTTSATYNHGKTKILKLIEKGKNDVLEICNVFDSTNSTQDDIGKAGVQLFGIMYGKC